MPETIKDGTGTGNQAKVDVTNRLLTRAITVTDAQNSADNGDAYNINTGKISISGAAASAIIYFKNNEDRNIHLESIAMGVSDGTVADIGELVMVRNPTGGDIISDKTAVAMNANRNFASNKSLTADVFNGKDGGTLTGGDDFALFFQGDNGRLFADVDTTIPKGASVGFTYDPNLASGTVNVYIALIVHLEHE